MNLLHSSFASLFVLSVAVAASQPPVESKSKAAASDNGRFVFSFLPKSLETNPDLNLTVVTEVTEEGKKLPPVSKDQPAYYITEAAGYVQIGDSSSGDKPPPPDEIERTMKKALAANGYLPANPPAQPPTLTVIYSWGSHNLLSRDDPSRSPTMVARNVLERALLVGGEKFAKELSRLFEQADALASANPPARTDPSGTVEGLGTDPVLRPDQLAFVNPVNQFKLKNPKNEFLVEQSADDCYYVVASAYDYAAMAHRQKKLLWRTRMTVNSKGVSQVQSVPALIATAAPYFGKDMPEPEILVRRVREGQITIGTPTVVEPPTAATTKR